VLKQAEDTMNAKAESWIKEHPLRENHGYILTSSSEKEFASLKKERHEGTVKRKPSIRVSVQHCQRRFVKTAFD
jgi:hypothetical protein